MVAFLIKEKIFHVHKIINVIFKQVKQNMLREDLRGICHRPCIYNDEGKCDMWDELSVPDETEKCDNQQEF